MPPHDTLPGSAEPPRGDIETALNQSQAFYHSLVETLSQSIFRKNLDGQFTFANSRFCQTIGLARDEIIGKTSFDLFPPEIAETYEADDHRVVSSGENYEMVEPYETASGTMYLQVIKTPVRDANGRIIGIQGIFWDVTERKLLEEQLQYERDLLRALLDNCPDSIYFKDVRSRFLRISKSLATQFSLADPAEAIGKTDADFHETGHAQQALLHLIADVGARRTTGGGQSHFHFHIFAPGIESL